MTVRISIQSNTPVGPLRAHRFFISGLMSLSKAFDEAREAE
jgi:hypothetical protein